MKKKRKIGRWVILLLILLVMLYPRLRMRSALQHVKGIEETFDIIEPYLEVLRNGEFARHDLSASEDIFENPEDFAEYQTILPEEEIEALEFLLMNKDLPERPYRVRTPGVGIYGEGETIETIVDFATPYDSHHYQLKIAYHGAQHPSWDYYSYNKELRNGYWIRMEQVLSTYSQHVIEIAHSE